MGLLNRPRKRSSLGDLSSLGVSLSMRTSRLDDDMLSRHASHPSDSEASDASEYGDEDEDDEEESEIASFDDGTANQEADSADLRSPNKAKSSSKKSSLASSKRSRRRGRKHEHHDEEALSSSPAPMLQFDDDILDRAEDTPRGRTASFADSRAPPQRSRSPADSLRVSSSRRGVSPSFTSSPVPLTKVASEEGAGPSIMFADDPHPRRQKADEADSLGYIGDLEVLVGGLPPTLLVHSNSMTVT